MHCQRQAGSVPSQLLCSFSAAPRVLEATLVWFQITPEVFSGQDRELAALQGPWLLLETPLGREGFAVENSSTDMSLRLCSHNNAPI